MDWFHFLKTLSEEILVCFGGRGRYINPLNLRILALFVPMDLEFTNDPTQIMVEHNLRWFQFLFLVPNWVQTQRWTKAGILKGEKLLLLGREYWINVETPVHSSFETSLIKQQDQLGGWAMGMTQHIKDSDHCCAVTKIEPPLLIHVVLLWNVCSV